MSNALLVAVIEDALNAAYHAAWDNVIVSGKAVTIDEDDRPRTIQDLPLVSSTWLDVEITFDGPNATAVVTDHCYKWQIDVHLLMPPAGQGAAGKVNRLKATWASDFIAQVQTGPGFAGVANFPLVYKVSQTEKSQRFEGAAMFSVFFSCHAAADHH